MIDAATGGRSDLRTIVRLGRGWRCLTPATRRSSATVRHRASCRTRLGPRRGAGRRRRRPRPDPTDARWAWIAVLFAASIIGGVAVVSRALETGEIDDPGLSPYHVVAYGGLLALSLTSLWLVVRARRRGAWRDARRGWVRSERVVLVLLAYVVLDVAWREGVGIEFGIENAGRAEPRAAPRRPGAGFDGTAASIAAGRRRPGAPLARRDLGRAARRHTRRLRRLQPHRQPVAGTAGGRGRGQRRGLADGRRRQPRLGSSRQRGARLRQSGLVARRHKDRLHAVLRPGRRPRSGDHVSGSRTRTAQTRKRSPPGRAGQWFAVVPGRNPRIAYTQEAAGGPWLSSGPVGPNSASDRRARSFPVRTRRAARSGTLAAGLRRQR